MIFFTKKGVPVPKTNIPNQVQQGQGKKKRTKNQTVAQKYVPKSIGPEPAIGKPSSPSSIGLKSMGFTLVVRGKTYLLRIINTALNNQLFFKLVGHRFTVVTIDAAYTNPYKIDILVLAPGQTTDVLITTNQPSGNYYMTTNTYSTSAAPFNDTVTTALLHYATAAPQVPPLLNVTDTPATATPQIPLLLNVISTSLTGLTTSPFWSPPNALRFKFGIDSECLGHTPSHSRIQQHNMHVGRQGISLVYLSLTELLTLNDSERLSHVTVHCSVPKCQHYSSLANDYNVFSLTYNGSIANRA
ncbi:hypothetical protein Scep_009770 [Stephania cephalantha]|uniref:Plastocyanin-like domain-containing protein n=1 Tax=Stephania cephalantha TaxID=152367 RepID=A0AAP0JUL2_9MAGN